MEIILLKKYTFYLKQSMHLFWWETQLFHELIMTTSPTKRIWSAGIYFDNNKFPNKTYFAPFAYKTELNTRKYQVEDLAR